MLKEIYYIVKFQNEDVWDDKYNDTGFTNKEDAYKFCEWLNKMEGNKYVKFEVFTLDLDMINVDRVCK